MRAARPQEATALIGLARRAQARLTDAGSIQRLSGYSSDNVAIRIASEQAFVLVRDGEVIGSVFLEPVTAGRFPSVWEWGVAGPGEPLSFLYGLVIDPVWQGQDLGRIFLQRLCMEVLPRPGVLVLDCWAGNVKLRRFYAQAGLTLHGVFPEDDYEVAVFALRTRERAQ